MLVVVLAIAVLFAIGIVTAVTRGEGLSESELRFSTPLTPEEIRARGVPVLLPLMAHHGYALREVDGDDLAIFRRLHRPRWTFYALAVSWPLGLLALTRRLWLDVAVRIETSDSGCVVVVEGEMTGALRRAVRASFEE